MAATTSFAASTRFVVAYGRSGYNNKPDDDDDKNRGRSGYNKGGSSDGDEDES